MISGKGMNILKMNNRVLLKHIDIKTLTQIASKPRVRVSFPEKVIHGIFLGSIPLICPLYLSCKFGQWTQEQMDAE